MKVLILAPLLPYPPHQGATLRNYHIIKELAERHTVDLLAFIDPATPGNEGADHSSKHQRIETPLNALCRNIAVLPQPTRTLRTRALDTLLSPLPDMALRLESKAMRSLVAHWVDREADSGGYDIVQIEGIEMAQYGLHALAQAKVHHQHDTSHQPALIFDDHNCEYLLQQRHALTDLRTPRRWVGGFYSLVQWFKLRRYEAHICQQATATIAVSKADKAALLRLQPDVNIVVLPNGIDVNEYSQPTEDSQPDAAAAPGGCTLVFTAKMDYRPNVDAVLWFAEQVFPLVQGQKGDVRLQIVGMNPHPRLDILRTTPGIEITGAVPDTKPYIRQATAYVIPMRIGGGTRFKALEAMACGTPIVSTKLGVEGFPLVHDRDLLIADNAPTFAESILRLIEDGPAGRQLRQTFSRRGREFVATHYDWQKLVPRLDELYVQVAGD